MTLVSIALVVFGIADVRETGRSGSPLLALGMFPALLCPIFFVHYLRMIRVFRDLRSGRRAIARWTLSPEEFERFREEERRIPTRSILSNFYAPPKTIPAAGVEEIFFDEGVLIGDGYFPLSTTSGRRVQSVRCNSSDPPSIEFGTLIRTLVRTSSATTNTVQTAETLRVPVSSDAAKQAGEVVRRFQALIDRSPGS